MKVIYVDPMSYNNLEEYDINLLKNIDGIEIIFLCNKLLSCNKINNVKIKKIYNYQNWKRSFKGISYFISQLILLIIILKEKEVKIVHFQWFKIYKLDYFFLKIIKKIKKDIQLILTVHNILPHDSERKYFKIHKKIYDSLDALIIHEEEAYNELVFKFGIEGKKIKIIQHGMQKKKVVSQESLEKKLTFGIIGRINKYKGLDILLDAWNDSEILKNKDIKLIVAGAGEINLAYKAKNIEIFNYFLSDKELEELIKEIDVFILPYKKISQSGVLLKVLEQHKPVVVSNIGGLLQPFKLGRVGWSFSVNNAIELRKIIKNIIKNKNEVENIKKDKILWKEIEAFYSWETVGNLTKNYYKEKLELKW